MFLEMLTVVTRKDYEEGRTYQALAIEKAKQDDRYEAVR